MTAHAGFFVTGGTLVPNAPCYVERAADRSLYEGLKQSEFCYVLTPRQMGKSSLMVRTAARLRAEGVCVAVLDLTMVGQMLTQEQWYYGLLQALAQQTRTRSEVRAFWAEQALLGPLQRWMAALREVVLPRCAGQLVVFVDEIDAVRSLPFNTDEFFAAIRECYNRRPHDPEMHRLTFCLVGVATPSDLIQDPRTTPFNIGRRIDLDDFTESEAAPLAAGLAQEWGNPSGRPTAETRELLHRVLYWTGGHPYLTQRLCQAVSERMKDEVDALCEELFLAPGARERDDNLMFVRERLLRSGGDLAGLLELYARVWNKKPVKDDALHPLISTLRLSGIVRATNGRLVVRNRIYAGAFDPEWVRSAMPDAEVQRQRKAYFRGMLRAAALSAALLAASVAGYVAFQQFTRAEQRGEALRLNRYVDDMRAAQQAIAAGETGQAEKLLAGYRPQPGKRDLRGFEWHYLSSLQERPPLVLSTSPGTTHHLAFLPDNQTLMRVGTYFQAQYWDTESGREVLSVPEPSGFSRTARENSTWFRQEPAVDRAGTLMARANQVLTEPRSTMADESWEVFLKRMRTGEEYPICRLSGWVSEVALSADGKLLAIGRTDPPGSRTHPARVELWATSPPKRLSELTLPEKAVDLLSFSPDGKWLAGAVSPSSVRILQVGREGFTGNAGTLVTGHSPAVSCVKFSPDSRYLAVGTRYLGMLDDTPGVVMLWQVRDGTLAGTLRGHRLGISDLSWSGRGDRLATLGREGAVRVWRCPSYSQETVLPTRGGQMGKIAFSRDGRRIAVAEATEQIQILRLPESETSRLDSGTGHPVHEVVFTPGEPNIYIHTRQGWRERWTELSGKHRKAISEFRSAPQAFSPDLRILARAEGEEIVLTDLADRRVTRVPSSAGKLRALVFAPGGTHLLAVSEAGNLLLYATSDWSSKLLHTLPPGFTTLAASRNAEKIAVYTANEGLFLWDRHRDQDPISVSTLARGPVSLTPDGRWLTFASQGGIFLLNCNSGKLRFFASTRQYTAEPFAISPDGTTLATSDRLERVVHLWNIETGRQTIAIPSFPSGVSSLTFASNPTRLAVGLLDGTVVLLPRFTRL